MAKWWHEKTCRSGNFFKWESNSLIGDNLKELREAEPVPCIMGMGRVAGYANEIHHAVLKDEIQILKSRIEPHDTGHLYTTISTLDHRISQFDLGSSFKSSSLIGANLEELRKCNFGRVAGYANEIHYAVLKDEIEILKSRIEPHDTGHLHTTIYTLEHRIKEFENARMDD